MISSTREGLEILKVEGQWNLERSTLSNFIRDYFADKGSRLNMLEAGCGRQWNLDLAGMDYVLTGLDISEEALRIRKDQRNDLDKIIVGDLESVQLENDEYDIIYCSYVLEHLKGAEKVLNKFFRWLKPDGLLVLIIPDRDTTRGFLTWVTPRWFHFLYHKYVVGTTNAGKPGFAPFRTYFDRVVSRRGIHDYCRRWGHRIYLEFGKAWSVKGRLGLFSPVAFMTIKLLEMVSFGRLTSNHCDLTYVIGKKKF